MDLLERIIYFTVGGGMGFILGYIVARLRTIETKVDEVKNEVHEVDNIVKHERDERGFMRFPLIADVAYLLALGLILLGLWGMAQERKQDAQDRENIEELSLCNTEYLRAQAEFLGIYLENPPASNPEQRAALENYVELLQAYATDDSAPLDASPYSNKDKLQQCIESDVVKEIEQSE